MLFYILYTLGKKTAMPSKFLSPSRNGGVQPLFLLLHRVFKTRTLCPFLHRRSGVKGLNMEAKAFLFSF